MFNQKGLTLIELVVSVTILAVVVTAIAGFFAFGTRAFRDGTKKVEIQRNTRTASDYLKDQIRNATGIWIQDQGGAYSSDYNHGVRINGTILEFFTYSIADGGQPAVEVTLRFENMNDTVINFVNPGADHVAAHYILSGISGTQTFDLEGEVLLNNNWASSFLLDVPGPQYSLKTKTLFYYRP